MRIIDSLWMPHAITALQLGAALLNLVASGLAVVQRIRVLRRRPAAGAPAGDDAGE